MKTKFTILFASAVVLAVASLSSGCNHSAQETAKSLSPEIGQSLVVANAVQLQDSLSATNKNEKGLTVSEFLNVLAGSVESKKTDTGYIFQQKITDEVANTKHERAYVLARFPSNQNAFLLSRVVFDGVELGENDILQLYGQMFLSVRGLPTEK